MTLCSINSLFKYPLQRKRKGANCYYLKGEPKNKIQNKTNKKQTKN